MLLPIQAQPSARRNAINGEHDGRLKVSITQAPEKGKANKAIIKFLAAELGISKSQLQIVQGDTSSHKLIAISGVDLHDLKAWIVKKSDHK